jgi:hypothetical protein
VTKKITLSESKKHIWERPTKSKMETFEVCDWDKDTWYYKYFGPTENPCEQYVLTYTKALGKKAELSVSKCNGTDGSSPPAATGGGTGTGGQPPGGHPQTLRDDLRGDLRRGCPLRNLFGFPLYIMK